MIYFLYTGASALSIYVSYIHREHRNIVQLCTKAGDKKQSYRSSWQNLNQEKTRLKCLNDWKFDFVAGKCDVLMNDCKILIVIFMVYRARASHYNQNKALLLCLQTTVPASSSNQSMESRFYNTFNPDWDIPRQNTKESKLHNNKKANYKGRPHHPRLDQGKDQ